MSTRTVLKNMNDHLDESIGLRRTELRPQLSPIAATRDIGRRANRAFGQIEIDRIQPDPDQPRTEFDSVTLEQLAGSIRDKGQLSPIRVRWSETHNSWLIISGERRWRASQKAGLRTIDCYFQERDLSPTQILEEQLIENLLRVDLRPVEEAESFQKLMTVNDWTAKELASALNISPTRVSRALALLKLPHELRGRVEEGELSARAGYELSKLPASQLATAPQVAQPITANQAAKVVKQRRGKSQPSPKGTRQTFLAENGWQIVAKSPRKSSYHDLEQALETALEEVRTRIRNRVQLT